MCAECLDNKIGFAKRLRVQVTLPSEIDENEVTAGEYYNDHAWPVEST